MFVSESEVYARVQELIKRGGEIGELGKTLLQAFQTINLIKAENTRLKRENETLLAVGLLLEDMLEHNRRSGDFKQTLDKTTERHYTRIFALLGIDERLWLLLTPEQQKENIRLLRRLLPQIYHPDRQVGLAEEVKESRDRLLREINDQLDELEKTV